MSGTAKEKEIKIAILEDDKLTLEVLTEWLEEIQIDGHILRIYGFGDYNSELKNQLFDVLITDLWLNGQKNGLTAVSELDVPAIVISGAQLTSEESFLLSQKKCQFIPKPLIKLEIVEESLREIISGFKSLETPPGHAA